ncbi:MAG: hypothetical protein A2Y23_01850 [Clostridiales bacterium GWB2_37_7]|nr:MAG: hypothetical protein A2Y23_01850 [Clostridiales bacterium GWB2_37_7]
MKVMHTNEICVNFNFSKIQRDFDIYKITTSEKYIPGGAFVLDKPLMTLKARSIVFEYGRSFYLLFLKDTIIPNDLRRILINEEKGDSLSLEVILAEQMPKHLLLQLFLNGINNPLNDILSFNNLTGKLICYRNDWINKDKENFIWGLDCLELKVSSDMCLNMMAHRMSSITLRKKMKFEKRQFHDYPQYLFADYNYAIKRADKETLNQKENFIMKPADDERASITYMNFENLQKFECTKIGLLYKVLNIIKEDYKDYLKVELKQYEINKCLEYRYRNLNQFKDVVKESVSSCGINLIDCIGNETSKLYLIKVKEQLRKIVSGVEVSTGKRISKQKLNIKLIHNKKYYEEMSYDPHNDVVEGAAVQHITLEDFMLNTDIATANVLKELIIKKDIAHKRISIINWNDFRYENDWIFGIKNNDHYYFMTIHPDGTFEIKSMVRDLFNMTDYDKLMDYFGHNDGTKGVYHNVLGLIRDWIGNINLIRDTNQITLPEVIAIGDTLTLADRNVKFLGSYVKEALEHIVNTRVISNKYIIIFEEVKKQFIDEVEYSKTEILKKLSSQTAKKLLTKYVLEDTGELLYLFLRSQEKRSELFPGVLDINYIDLGPKEAIYNVGTVGAGMQPYIERASVVRQIEAVEGDKLFFKELLPLMGVEFVRYGMLTVIPFPFKYLREYASLAEQLIKAE